MRISCMLTEGSGEFDFHQREVANLKFCVYLSKCCESLYTSQVADTGWSLKTSCSINCYALTYQKFAWDCRLF